MPLSDTAVRNAKPGEKQRKMYDEKGLYLIVHPNGGKWWRFRYKLDGKEKTISIGVYPDVTLSKARKRRDEYRVVLADGGDPSFHKKTKKQTEKESRENSFEAITREWLDRSSVKWVESYTVKLTSRFERYIFPRVGNKPITEVTAPELLQALRHIESTGAHESAHRTHQNCSQVFRYAIATGRADRDPAADLKGALIPAKTKHHASITEPAKVGELLRAIDSYQGEFITKCGLQMIPYVFVRPGELRHAEWSEIDFDLAEWHIPAEKMKMPAKQIVPLSDQVIAILESLHPLTGRWKYVFPGIRSKQRPMSENTLNAGLRRLGYTKEEMTSHGFRSMASTLLNEQGFNRDWIERQLAHTERDSVRAAYNYAEYLSERKRMMQHWADYLDNLRADKKVITGIFNRSGS